LKLLFRILLVFSVFSAAAQESEFSIPIDSLNKNRQFIPTGIRLGADILGPALNIFGNQLVSYEFTVDTDFSNYNLMIELGHQQFAEKNDNVDYTMKGNFARIGPEVNFLSTDKQLNNFTFGLRYAWSSFTETVIGDVVEDNWGAVPVNFDTQKNRSYWVEMTTGLKVRLYKGLFTGYVLRFRFLRSGTQPDVPFAPYYVPGYGLADRENTWGFRYYVMYRFQWSKKPVKVKVIKSD
jgi:Domain of unknown function (DUF6048)